MKRIKYHTSFHFCILGYKIYQDIFLALLPSTRFNQVHEIHMAIMTVPQIIDLCPIQIQESLNTKTPNGLATGIYDFFCSCELPCHVNPSPGVCFPKASLANYDCNFH